MSSSQRLSSILCISYLCSTANGFTAVFRPTPIHSQFHSDAPFLGYHEGANRQKRRFMNLSATKGKAPETELSSSDKVKEMASFLSIQLLEKVMAEAMKPEGEGTMDLEAVERLTQALQTTSQSSPETSTPTSEATDVSTEAEDVSLSMDETATTVVEEVVEPAPAETSEDKSEDTPLPSAVSGVASETTETISETVEEEKVPAPAPEPVAVAPSIPEIVRAPLEVIQADIPPLRPESVPQRSEPTAEEEVTIEEVVAVTSNDEEEAVSDEKESPDVEDTIVEEENPNEEIDEALILAEKKAKESFQRRLLQQKLEFDKKARIEMEASSEETPSSDDEETQKGESTINDIVSDAPETEQDVASEIRTEESESLTKSSSDLADLERRVETIVALRQPKSMDEELKLAEKYAQMANLEDRAYTLLVDLGMIDEHKDPKDPDYDHSKDDDLCDQRFLPLL